MVKRSIVVVILLLIFSCGSIDPRRYVGSFCQVVDSLSLREGVRLSHDKSDYFITTFFSNNRKMDTIYYGLCKIKPNKVLRLSFYKLKSASGQDSLLNGLVQYELTYSIDKAE